VVVGGGPAGLMAAERLAQAGCQVHVYDHMPSVARKLVLAGRSGLNLTHDEPVAQLLARYGDAPVVRAAVAAFPPAALRDWAASLGQPTYVGSSGRVFPTAFRATPLVRAWLARLATLGVQVHPRHRWAGWAVGADGAADLTRPQLSDHDGVAADVRADVTVLALGGASWPRVGSDGAWTHTLESTGVRVAPLRPANCGVRVAWSAAFADRFAGTPVKNVALEVSGVSVRGDLTITPAGLESGPVYPLSSTIRDLCERDGRCIIHVDLHPDLELAAVRQRLQARRSKDSLATFLRRSLGLSPAAIGLLREATDNQLPTDHAALAALVKHAPLTVHGTEPLARAISTAGGIALDEVDDHLMLHALPGVFVAGEMLDWDAPTGGYLLQASFSTGVAAALGAQRWLSERQPAGRRPLG
jgi:uncharacterized flavoprotein (TIGR03862 family)